MPSHPRLCQEPGCERSYWASGMCRPHYNRQWMKRYTKICEGCGKQYVTTRRLGRVCSLDCRFWIDPRRKLATQVPKTHPCRRPLDTPEPMPPQSKVFMRDCDWCGTTYVGRDKQSLYCSDRCKIRVRRMRRDARVVGADGTWSWTQLMHLFLLHDKTCAYCHEPIEGQPDPDHVVALSRGGHNSISNLLPSCRPCNTDKRNLTLDEWEVDRARRGLPPRTVRWDEDDLRYRHLSLRPALPRAS